MSKIDSFDLVPVFGHVGELRGYLQGLRFRLKNPERSIGEADLANLENVLNRLDKYLSVLIGLEDSE